ncbi:E3 ubiquitin/ISG15 ligase TRIM25 isoform X2 [Esox lucius]|uniref:E3 ubiquitin/ISG15 ligase TRIM25 isoform X2 n=1 Tax=Esox lucius TaxID=8010 RepID=UPI0009733923|nr:E3 ubiquitin/ISG15 ligase TRIM25 isoform X2 [Esox lucius]
MVRLANNTNVSESCSAEILEWLRMREIKDVCEKRNTLCFRLLRFKVRPSMATSIDQSSVLEDELTCPVCLDVFRDPHLLPCGHSFCLLCLYRLKRRAERSRFRCPECRETHRCSSTYQKNFKLANIADDYRRRGMEASTSQRPQQSQPASSKTPVSVPCDYCPPVGASVTDEKGEPEGVIAVTLAVKTCLKCEVSMCKEHVKPHMELPAFREHILTEPLGDLRKRKCPEHDEMYRYYCMDDKVCICNACTIEGGHSGHTIKTLKNTMKDLKASLQIQLQKVDGKLSKAERALQEQKELERQNKRFLEGCDQRVTALGEVLQVHLASFLANLRDCPRSLGCQAGPNIQRNIARVVQDQSRLQEARGSIQTLVQENDPFCFLQAYKSSSKRQWKKPLFCPENATINPDGLAEAIEAKQEEFLTEVRSRVSLLIDELCPVVGEEDDSGAEEEDDYDDEADEDGSDGDELDEAEEEMRSEEEDINDQNESADELYSPEGEEDDEVEEGEEEEEDDDEEETE